MQLLEAIVQSTAQPKTTRFGDRVVVDCLINGEKKGIWGNPGDATLTNLKPGQRISVIPDKNSFKVVETNTQPQSTMHLVTSQPQPQSEQLDINAYIDAQADILHKCIVAISDRIYADGGTASEDTIQKYATTLYIQVSKKF